METSWFYQKWMIEWKSLRHVQLFVTLWTIWSMEARILKWVVILFSRVLPNPGIEPRSPTLQVDSLPAEPPGKPHPRFLIFHLLKILGNFLPFFPCYAFLQCSSFYQCSFSSPHWILLCSVSWVLYSNPIFIALLGHPNRKNAPFPEFL